MTDGGRTERNECEGAKERMEVSEKGGRRMAREEKANKAKMRRREKE